jgi:hypothetical protein
MLNRHHYHLQRLYQIFFHYHLHQLLLYSLLRVLLTFLYLFCNRRLHRRHRYRIRRRHLQQLLDNQQM